MDQRRALCESNRSGTFYGTIHVSKSWQREKLGSGSVFEDGTFAVASAEHRDDDGDFSAKERRELERCCTALVTTVQKKLA